LTPPAPPAGVVTSLNAQVLINGSPVATVGPSTWILTHGDPKIQPLCQKLPPILKGINSILVNGQPIAHVGSVCQCGHLVANGIPTVLVSGV
jgi:uncharacterized Zn-binding protein involved in type VI secretion